MTRADLPLLLLAIPAGIALGVLLYVGLYLFLTVAG